jgi:hypothetical protein
MLLALGVGALPVGLGFVMALFDSETTAAGSGTVAAPTAQSARCLPTEMLRINATTAAGVKDIAPLLQGQSQRRTNGLGMGHPKYKFLLPMRWTPCKHG